tara:strand:+ start:528 stop:1253 length:726 start_codon:yes stop_codon:yes gene_type:complete
MSLKKLFFKTKLTYKIYLYYNLYLRHKGFLKRKRYSQWGEDKIIFDFFKNINKGIYLDIGCFHPFMYSNTCLLYKKGWNGINIDINPTSIDLFNIARPTDVNLCTTINNEKKIYDIFYDDPLSPVNTIDEKFYKNLKKTFFRDERKMKVETKSIEEIIKISKITKKINFINIDAEGKDYELLTQIKIDKLKPNLIAIETHNIDGSAIETFPLINKYMENNNYNVYKRVGPTTLFNKNTDFY